MLKAILLTTFLLLSHYSAIAEESCNKFQAYANQNAARESGAISNVIDNGQNLGPTRDQDSVGFCYAYAAADMMESHLKRNGQMSSDQNVSAMAVALTYHENDGDFANGLMSYNKGMDRRDSLSSSIRSTTDHIASLRQRESDLEEQRYRALKRSSWLRGLTADPSRAMKDVIKDFEKGSDRLKQTALDLINKATNLDKERTERRSARSQRGRRNSQNGEESGESSQEQGVSEDEISRIDQELAMLRSNIQTYEQALEDLERERNEIDISEGALVPGGGWVKDAVDLSWNRICFESEVSSRDAAIKEIFQNQRELFSNLAFAPSSLEAVLGNFALKDGAEDNPQMSCSYYLMLSTMFPGLPFGNPQTMMEFFNQLDLQSDMFKEILNNSCAERSLSPEPNITYSKVSHVHPIQGNDQLFATLDEALERGTVASINYRSDLFSRNDFATANRSDYHASAVVGKLNVCGEPHYIIRNSWGQDSCKNKQRNFRSTNFSNEEKSTYSRDSSVCRVEAERIYNQNITTCPPTGQQGLDCRAEVLNAQSAFLQTCVESLDTKKYEDQNHQFFCDDQGNFIVSKDYLKGAVYGVYQVTN